MPFVGTDFPLNDGGLFATMIQDLVNNRLLLPASTTYNGLDIPFAYPPLAFYVAALANQAFGFEILDILRGLPVVLSLATVVAVYWLGRGSWGPGREVSGRSWLRPLARKLPGTVTGGGITRASGSSWPSLRWGSDGASSGARSIDGGLAVMLGLAGGLCALAHPQAALFLATSLVVFLPWAANWRHAVTGVAVSGVIGLAVLATWLIPVVAVHGVDPLISAMQSGKQWSGGPGSAVLRSDSLT